MELLGDAASSLDSDDEAIRFSAAWAVTLLSGSTKAMTVLKSVAESKSPLRLNALVMALRRIEPAAAKSWLRDLLLNPSHARLAIAGAAAVGDPEISGWLIEQMSHPGLGRVAGEAFTMITGLDISREHLEGKSPDGFEAGPNDNPKDENVAPDEDEGLPWPDPVLIEEWWQRKKGQFQNGTRYLLGKPITLEWLQQVLRIGRQRHRAAAALELAIRQPGLLLFNVAAPGFQQAAMLGLKLVG
jgi:uncharacterized protein (TIGR02270 family)